MAKKYEFSTELETAEWQMKYADAYCNLLKEKAAQAGVMNSRDMIEKIENVESSAAIKRSRYESLTAYSKGEAK